MVDQKNFPTLSVFQFYSTISSLHYHSLRFLIQKSENFPLHLDLNLDLDLQLRSLLNLDLAFKKSKILISQNFKNFKIKYDRLETCHH